MKDYLIKDYIKKLTLDDVKHFAQKENITLTESDAIILYTYAKKHYEVFINGNDDHLIQELKEKLSPNTFKEAYKIYLKYKIKYLK